MKHLRDYQIDAANAIEREWETFDSTLAVMATGLGKTVLFAEIIRRREKLGKHLVLVHREELAFQAREKIERFTGLQCEIEMADLTASDSLLCDSPVIIATVQTLLSGRQRKRMEKDIFKPDGFSTLILDEAHHGPADSWGKVLAHFKQNTGLKMLGVTATPDRHDEQAMGQVFESVAVNMGILEGINAGWLVPIQQQFVVIEGLDFSAVKTTAGDLNGAELAAIMEAEKNLHGLCSATLDIIENRQTLVFTASVKHAEAACNIFNRHRNECAEWICGTTPKENRRKIMENMHANKTQILVNVGVAVEGWDCPSVEVIVMGRPTKSRSLFTQMCGRGTRPLAGVVDGLEDTTPETRQRAIASSPKKSALVIDFVGVTGRHKLISTLDVLGGKFSEEERELAREFIEEEGAKDTEEALEQASEELQSRRRKKMEEAARVEEERKRRIKAKATYTAKAVDPFNIFEIAPPTAQDENIFGVLTSREKEVLTWNKVKYDDMSYAAALALYRECTRRYKLGLATLNQIKTLARYGIDAKELPKSTACGLLDKLAANGWKALPITDVSSSEQITHSPVDDDNIPF